MSDDVAGYLTMHIPTAAGFDAPAAMDVVATERYQAPPLEIDAEHYYRHQAPTIGIIQQPPLFHHRAPAATGNHQFANNNGKDELAALFRGMDLAGNNAAVMEVEPADDVRPVEEDPTCFVGGQLDCTNCRTVPEILHESVEQRKRISSMSMADIANRLHMSRKEAATHLKISSTFKRLCSKNGTHGWPACRINALDKKIKKLEDAAARNGGMRGIMLAIKEKLDDLMLERAQLYTSTMKLIRQNEMKGAGPSGSK